MVRLQRSPAARKRPRVGETPLARELFAGRYAKVVGATFDAQGTTFDDADVAFAVGALTFLGRIEDAELCFDTWRRRSSHHDARTVVASRFFLGVAHARAGNFRRAYELLVDRVRPQLKSDDAWCAAFAFQGLACQRYFTGQYRAAARHALRALRAAHLADFAYGKMLATDLRGHAVVQIGQLRAGLGLLERAKDHAERLGLGMNAYAIECSIANYGASFLLGDEVLQHVERLLTRRSHDSYSRHALLTTLAVLLSLRGRRRDALRALEQAEEHALEIDARRAKVTSLLARLHVTRWSAGPRACAALVEETSELVDERDLAFRAELYGFALLVAREGHDDRAQAEAEASLKRLATAHDLHWARAALEQFGEAPVRTRSFSDDRLTPLLRAAAAHDRRALPTLLAERLLGAIPEALGLTPGRRVLILVAENAVLLEDHGELVLRPHPPRWCPPLLRLLARGDVAKEVIVASLWGLRSYRPERHDPLLRTTIHRLRAFLEPYGSWIEVTESGYGTRVPVVVIGDDDEASPIEASLEVELGLEDPELPSVAFAVPRPALVDAGSSIVERVFTKLVTLPHASVRDVTRAIGCSTSTALRALRELVAAKRVVRTGFARATRYSVRDQA